MKKKIIISALVAMVLTSLSCLIYSQDVSRCGKESFISRRVFGKDLNEDSAETQIHDSGCVGGLNSAEKGWPLSVISKGNGTCNCARPDIESLEIKVTTSVNPGLLIADVLIYGSVTFATLAIYSSSKAKQSSKKLKK